MLFSFKARRHVSLCLCARHVLLGSLRKAGDLHRCTLGPGSLEVETLECEYAVDSFRRSCLAEVLALVEDNRKNGTSQIAGKEGLKTLLGTDPNASDACEDLPCNCGLGEECIKTKEPLGRESHTGSTE